jgi:hypothetical protein
MILQKIQAADMVVFSLWEVWLASDAMLGVFECWSYRSRAWVKVGCGVVP